MRFPNLTQKNRWQVGTRTTKLKDDLGTFLTPVFPISVDIRRVLMGLDGVDDSGIAIADYNTKCSMFKLA